MQKKLLLAVLALCYTPFAFAQVSGTEGQKEATIEESSFTFTEAQLGEDDDMSQNVTIISSNNNIYANEVGYLFSPVRFRYRAFNQRFNDVYINGVQMNDMESGQFRYSLVGGLNQQTRGVEFALPFENNNFSMTGMAGSNNYNFRPANMATGQRLTLTGANRNYLVRGMYTYNSGLNEKGWAYSANITYRWANEGYVEGTFYNSLSYFLGVEKLLGDQHEHAISFVTWGNPTERASQGASTDEMYWLANNNQYNPYWGWQDGKKRNSRVVHDFSPTALLTWDWKIDDNTRLTTSLLGRYSIYKSTKLNYNDSDNPQPDYWKLLPSSYYDVWDETDIRNRTDQNLEDWNTSYKYMTASKRNRQIDWDKLYYANRQVNEQGADAMYYLQAKHNDNLNIAFSTALHKQLTKNSIWNIGLQAATNKGMHYQTMEDLLGANNFHNLNTYAIGTYAPNSDEVQYDMNNPNAVVREGDRFGYDFNILVNKATAWTNYAHNFGKIHLNAAAKIGGVTMQRDGKMRNGMAPENSYGKSGTAKFLDGGVKIGATMNLGHGHTVLLGAGYEKRAPLPSTAFVSPEINNDFVVNLDNESVLSSEVGYQYQNARIHLNINGYYSQLSDVTEYQNFYFDDINSFSYVSLSGIKKAYYGVEVGMKYKITSSLDFMALGTISEAKNTNNANVWYMKSTSGTFNDANGGKPETVYNKNMREAGTPLTAASVGLSYHASGWFIDLNCNYYDRIYLSYSPSYRYGSTLQGRQEVNGDVYDNEGNILESALAQSEGKGGFMVDASIGRTIRMKHGNLSINLSITNLLNNTKLCTGGYEQSRSDYTASGNVRAYKFSLNPKKYYAYGTNGMINLAYKF